MPLLLNLQMSHISIFSEGVERCYQQKKRKEKLLFAPLREMHTKKDFCYHEKETKRFLQRFITKLPAVVGGACVKQHVIAKNTLKLYWDHETVG